MLTEVLLDVTNSEMQAIAEEVLGIQQSKTSEGLLTSMQLFQHVISSFSLWFVCTFVC